MSKSAGWLAALIVLTLTPFAACGGGGSTNPPITKTTVPTTPATTPAVTPTTAAPAARVRIIVYSDLS